MLKKSLNEFNNFFEKINNEWAILTVGDRQNGLNGMTVSWGGIGVLWNKNVCFVFVRHSRYTFELLEKTDSVTLSFLSDKYKEDKVLFGTKSGRDIEKFEASNLHPTLDVDFNGYYVAEASQVIKGKKIYSVDMPYDTLPAEIKEASYAKGDMHRMYVIEIKQYLDNEE